mgnify:CR=1 FL=1
MFLALAVALLDGAARQEAKEGAVGGRDGEGAEGEAVALDAGENLGDGIVGRDHRGVADHAVDVLLDATDLGDLIGLGHIVVQQAEAAVERHGDGKA